MEAGSLGIGYNPPATFPIPMKEPTKFVIKSGAAVAERTGVTIPP
jgi:hypothetical protein